MESFDQSLKYLLQHAADAFIRFGLGDPTVAVLRPVASGLPARSRDVDGAYLIARVRSGKAGEAAEADKRVVHLELHRRHQGLEDLGVDVAEAQIRLYRRERRLILSQVWDLYGDDGAPVLEERTLSYGEAGSQCVYQRVNLRGMGWEELLSRGPPALWPLVALTRDGQSKEVILKARSAIEGRKEWSSTEQADHLAILWFVAEAEGVAAGVITAYLSEERLMESELYKSIFGKGEAKAYTDMLIRLLVHRTGMIDPVVRAQIQAVSDVETLKRWYDEALDAVDAAAARDLVYKISKAAHG